ncbi:MAG TPA: SusD/RagB family nutrient-binding outer membrane lipoprotein [Longimicrobiaceae bacterium]|nr:SusD/RagB family nutrient-binding outer membrane lipoprotein [Longimicrobiaceae bacterium]
MKLSHIKKSASVLALAFMASACDDGLTELNVNPNAPEDVSAELLFPQAIQSSSRLVFGSGLHLNHTALWVQHFAKIQYTNEDRYFIRVSTNNAFWNSFYAGSLADVGQVIEKAQANNRPNQVASGKILQQWIFGVATDTYGDIPYTEASKGLETITGNAAAARPKYDPQPVIYRGILTELANASQMIQPGQGGFGAADLIYQGDMNKWRKLANSLRLRHSMRLSELVAKKPSELAAANIDPKAQFQAAMSAGVFTANADNALMRWTTSKPTHSPIHSFFFDQGRFDHTISQTIVDTLRNLSDPRLPVYATLPPVHAGKDPSNYELYNGAQNAANQVASFPTLSRIGDFFLALDAPSPIMTYAEVLFLQAEAAERGWIAGNAADLYRRAIQANMQFYGISQAQIDAYLAQPRVQYSGLNSIYLQKWIALYGNGPEAWIDWRRTGVPNITPGPRAVNSRRVPVRLPYPTNEQSVNNENLQAAVTRQGGGLTFNTPVWWDL